MLVRSSKTPPLLESWCDVRVPSGDALLVQYGPGPWHFPVLPPILAPHASDNRRRPLVLQRPSNKGLRLDYFLCSSGLFVEAGEEPSRGQRSKTKERRAGRGTPTEHEVSVHDCFQLDKATVGLSDHCPVGLVLRV